jgi:hypothetical protein
MHPHQHPALAGHLAQHQGQVFLIVVVVVEQTKLKFANIRGDAGGYHSLYVKWFHENFPIEIDLPGYSQGFVL